MANVKVTWDLPTTRQSGKPLPIDAIAGVRIELSADGANFGVIDTLPSSVLETVVTDLEPGDWTFRGTVLDTAGRPSTPVVSVISIADNTPPGALLSLNLSLI